MGNYKTNLEKAPLEEILKDLTQEQRDFLALVKAGRKDPVFFAEKMLGLQLHDGQKLWIWVTTKTQKEKACELGIRLGIWTSPAVFNHLLERNPDFVKNILVPSNRW